MNVQKKRAKFDYSSPEVRAMVDEVVHGTFMKEGTMIAFPTHFPGATVPIVPDESHITALDVTPSGLVYGGTSGKRAHVFVGMFHGVTGMVLDFGAVEGATHCAAVCCGKQNVLACVNGPGGGKIVSAKLARLPFDLIQEWGFGKTTLDVLGEPSPGEPIVHAIPCPKREHVIGITPHHLFTADMASGKIQRGAEVSGSGRLAMTTQGTVVGLDGTTHLWNYDPAGGTLKREAYRLPGGKWGKAQFRWAKDPVNGILYTADDDRRLFTFHGERGFSGPLAKAQVAPIGPMAATFDGRVFGFCGPDLAKMFCYDPHTGQISDLGVAVSVFERRRYGYVFGDAVTGRDGEIVFGEDDDFGHVWLYFPKILKA
ncbi:MAG: hypothetical protein ABFD60_02785 [Bryobacteraceae bacterium]